MAPWSARWASCCFDRARHLKPLTKYNNLQTQLLSAMPAERERRLLQDQLQLAIGYFSGSQTALDYQPLFEERQRLYCSSQHPLFAGETLSADDLQDCDRVVHPYRFIAADEPWQGGSSSARCEQVEGSLAFILSGAHLGYLPEHIAQPRVNRGGLRALPGTWDFTVQFRLASHRGHPPSEAQKRLQRGSSGCIQHLLKHPGSIVVVPSSPHLLEYT